MKKLLAALLGGIAAAAISSAALAAPRAESAVECGIAADMAVVARSLAEEKVQRPQASAIMARIYDVSQSARGRELMRDILDAAYRNEGDSQKFADELFAACMKTGGNMDTVLGRRL
jgi:hypothetical protein